MRVFLDTNVIISAFITRGLCSDLFRAVLVRHELVLSPVVLRELERVLSSKFGLPKDNVSEIAAFLKPYVRRTKSIDPPDLALDNDDLQVLAAALALKADVLISGDDDLLRIRDRVTDLAIRSPREFWDQITAPGR